MNSGASPDVFCSINIEAPYLSHNYRAFSYDSGGGGDDWCGSLVYFCCLVAIYIEIGSMCHII